ncbi:hypothetical protein KCV87_07780 [Actinosynnema pretiosum subsp. pretiosum]|uniref:DUF6968 domain-containing protein n=1 Tax=Actinosynnema pretiosum subsp. pretiosum TaxID=103721 RepID=A0AA45R5H5_9PSEU|nr:hypothetical protein [Actinosynnema mirum]AXX29838.1 hypothetical protein APASM_2473 [Actinosynnema pretiosum subsp. pretiosum]QUF05957.1 hypothetical protein KCV87_07780 [Actinosynnema pretiosum subsp. pretiosum]
MSIGRPRPFDETDPEGDHHCPVRIEGLEEDPVDLSVAGVDSLQALILALGAIGDRVGSARQDLSFLGRPELGLLASQRVSPESTVLSVRMSTA